MSAFEGLVERHRDRVYGLSLRMLRSEADAAEIAQETFLAAYKNLSGFGPDSSFVGWVCRVAANFALMRLRKKRVADSVEADLAAGPDFNERGSLAEYPQSDWSRRADEQVLDHELGVAIRQATEALPEGYRQVFLLKDVDGLSYEQIAEITGETVQAIKSRLHRARLSLREAIDHFYNER